MKDVAQRVDKGPGKRLNCVKKRYIISVCDLGGGGEADNADILVRKHREGVKYEFNRKIMLFWW